MPKWPRTMNRLLFFSFSKFLVSGRGNASKDGATRGVTRGVFLSLEDICSQLHHISQPLVTTADFVLEKKSEKQDNKS